MESVYYLRVWLRVLVLLAGRPASAAVPQSLAGIRRRRPERQGGLWEKCGHNPQDLGVQETDFSISISLVFCVFKFAFFFCIKVGRGFCFCDVVNSYLQEGTQRFHGGGRDASDPTGCFLSWKNTMLCRKHCSTHHDMMRYNNDVAVSRSTRLSENLLSGGSWVLAFLHSTALNQ